VLIATIRPRDLVGKTRRRLAVEMIGELKGIDRKIKIAVTGSGALCTPEATVSTRPESVPSRRPPTCTASLLFIPVGQPDLGSCRNEASDEGSLTFTHPVFPSPVAPGRNERPCALPRASHPAITGHARQGGDRSWTLTRSYVSGIYVDWRFGYSLNTCDLVSQRSAA
jgi:hypothetical protein